MNITQAELYNCARNAEEVAAERGQIVVYPLDNQLQIDIDSPEQREEFMSRLGELQAIDIPLWVTEQKASKTKGCCHIYLQHEEKTFTEIERMLWQAALGDDPKRVFLNFLRYQMGDPKPSRLFENPVDKH